MLVYVLMAAQSYFNNPLISISSSPTYEKIDQDHSVITLAGGDLAIGVGFTVEISPSIGKISFEHSTNENGKKSKVSVPHYRCGENSYLQLPHLKEMRCFDIND
jgi:hypothetical protein